MERILLPYGVGVDEIDESHDGNLLTGATYPDYFDASCSLDIKENYIV
jgi:hypothetical protein